MSLGDLDTAEDELGSVHGVMAQGRWCTEQVRSAWDGRVRMSCVCKNRTNSGHTTLKTDHMGSNYRQGFADVANGGHQPTFLGRISSWAVQGGQGKPFWRPGIPARPPPLAWPGRFSSVGLRPPGRLQLPALATCPCAGRKFQAAC